MHPMRQFQHRQGSRHPDRPTALERAPKRLEAAVRLLEVIRPRRPWRRLAPVKGSQASGLGVPIEHEGTTADPRGLRLHHIQHHLHRHGGIHGVTAARENRVTSMARQGMGRGDHEFLRHDRGMLNPPGRGLGRRTRGLGDRDINRDYEPKNAKT